MGRVFEAHAVAMFSQAEGIARLIGQDEDLADRVQYFPASDPTVIEQIRFGVLFVMAWWSGPARQNWAGLKRLLRELDPDRLLKVIVLDIDGMAGFEKSVLGPTVAGAGEMTWVKDGTPACPKWVFPSDAIRVNTRLFLEGRELFIPIYGSPRGND